MERLKTMTRDALKAKMDRADDFVLDAGLPTESGRHRNPFDESCHRRAGRQTHT